MRGDLWRPSAIVVTLLALLTILLIQSRSSDLVLFERMHEALRNYDLYDAELTRDVLSARAGLLANYDPLAEDRKHLHGTLEELRKEGAAGSKEVDALLQRPIEMLDQAQTQKLSDVEHFKSANALLRNSLMYLTFAGPILHIPEAEKRIAGEAARLSYAVLRFVQVPDPGVAAEIQAVLDRLAAVRGSHPELTTLVAHGRLIVTLAPQTDALLRQITSAPTSSRAHELQAAVLQQTDKVEQRAQVFRVLLYVVALLLLGYVVFQFIRLRSGAQRLRQTNISLQREMNERARAAAALRASDARFRAISESAKEAIVSVEPGGMIAAWNAGATAMFGYLPGEILGLPFTCLSPPRYRNAHQQAFSHLLDSDDAKLSSAMREFAGLRKNGEEFPLEVSLATWATDEGRFLTAIMRDISERRRLEETTRQQELQLIQTNRMAVVGQLVSFVVHEINNPTQVILENSLTVVNACSEALALVDSLAQRPQGTTLAGLPYAEMREKLPQLGSDIHDQALLIKRNVAELRDFYGAKSRGGAEAFDLNDSVARTVRFLTHQIDKKTRQFRSDLSPGLPKARGDAQHFEQVAGNLLVNALESLPDQSCAVSVSTAFDAARERLILVVEDQGVGIAKADLARVCDPFFTTKQASGGTGLGLAISSILLKNLGGHLRYESQVGKGTRATVELGCARVAAVPDATSGSL
jgi:PAS domain S-box-containing protein